MALLLLHPDLLLYPDLLPEGLLEMEPMMVAFQLADPSYVRMTPSHSTAYGQCPLCRVIWSRRPDLSCDCFFLGSQAVRSPDWERSRVLIEAIEILSTLTGGEAL